VVSGGITGREAFTREVWRLGLERLVWESLPDLARARSGHACCAVRGGTLVALGGRADPTPALTASVEVQDTRAAGETALSRELPQLSRGSCGGGSALLVSESESGAGQVLLLGGSFAAWTGLTSSSEVWRVDLATGPCTPQPHLGRARSGFAAARLPGGRVVCAGGQRGRPGVSAEMWEPTQGTWRDLPDMSAPRNGAAGCVLSDGRFAVLGGVDAVGGQPSSSWEALALDGTERWEPMPPMHQARCGFAAAAVGGCVIVAGGRGVLGQPALRSVEVYDEVAGLWRRLQRASDLPRKLCFMGSALL